MKLEEWRPIPGFPSYAISEGGTVMRIVDGPRAKRGYIYSACAERYGHLHLGLHDEHGVMRQPMIHRLVLLAFVGPPPTSAHHAAHWDGDPSNNHVSNLRWATPAENGADTARHGRLAGENNRRAKLTLDAVRSIRAQYSGARGELSRLARQYGVSLPTIRYAIDGTTWRNA